MTIGIAGPMTLKLIDFDWQGKDIPNGYEFPFTSYIINELLNRGIKVIAFTHSPGIGKPKVFEDDRITICVGRKTDHPGRSFFSLERSDLVSLMKKYPPDVINAQWSYEFAWAALDSGIPTVITVRDHAVTIFRYFKDLYRFVRLIMNFLVLRRANHIITNSGYLRDLLNKRNRENAVVISNFYQPFLESYFKVDKLRSNTIVSVCNGFDERKNVKNGLKAFKLFREKFPGFRLKLIGVGMEINGHAHKYAKENKLDVGVDFEGYLPFDKVIEVISNSDILLHPSREESFGNTILEALVVGTNVVAGEKSGNVPYLLDHGNVGFLCDVNSPQSISEALNKCVSDTQKFEECRIKGREFAVENFSKEAVMQKLINVYHNLL